jgi:hypothetical protein
MFSVLVLCGTIDQPINQSILCNLLVVVILITIPYRFFLDDATAAVKVSCFLFLVLG